MGRFGGDLVRGALRKVRKVKATADRTGGAFSDVEFEHPVGFARPPHVHGTSDEAYSVTHGPDQRVLR